jgi:hypothetical protein
MILMMHKRLPGTNRSLSLPVLEDFLGCRSLIFLELAGLKRLVSIIPIIRDKIHTAVCQSMHFRLGI